MFFSNNDTDFTEEAKAILPVSAALEREKLWPYLERVERKYILPLLGRELYDDLIKYHNDSGSWSGSGEDAQKTAELVSLIRIGELNLAFFTGFDVFSVMISSAGFQRSESEKFKGLYKYQETNLKTLFAETGYDAIDDILTYLEDNIEYFPEWEESATNQARLKSLIKDASTFNSICDIKNSRLTFLRLLPFMKQVVDMEIIPTIGAALWTKLQSEMTSDSPDSKYIALVPKLRDPLAFLSSALLVLNTGDLTDRGLYFESRNSLYPDPSTSRPGEGDTLAMRYKFYREPGLSYLASVKKYLADNSFTEYSGASESIYNRDNDGKKTFVA